MSILRTCNAVMLTVALALGVAACDDKDGPAEEIGEEIDDAAGKVKSEAKEAKREIKEEIDEAEEELKD